MPDEIGEQGFMTSTNASGGARTVSFGVVMKESALSILRKHLSERSSPLFKPISLSTSNAFFSLFHHSRPITFILS